MKISKAWIVIIIIILIVIGYFFIKSAFKSATAGLVIEKVQKGEVLQEISETGSVKATEDISLGFKSIGKIAKIDVAVGDSVKKGDILAELDLSQTSAQLQSAQSALSYTASQYDSGVALAKDNLQSAYNGALSALNNGYTAIFNADAVAKTIQDTYFKSADSSWGPVHENRANISNQLVIAEASISQVNSIGATDSVISSISNSLSSVLASLQVIRDQTNTDTYTSMVSAADKTLLDSQKTAVSSALSSVSALQSSIASYKIVLQKAQDSTVQQAQANVNALQSQLNDNYLTSPMDGIITDVNIKKGQVISPSEAAINMLSTEAFQIKVAIYEQDIVNVKVGDSVKINLVAFPQQTYPGKVLSIDPAETIIDNVVYYQVTIEFPNQPVGIRSGMTADITIEANKKDNVLRIPKNAVLQTDSKQTVQIVKNVPIALWQSWIRDVGFIGIGRKIKNATITTGLEGNDYFEVTSGLTEGDEIITGKQ